MEIAHTIQLWLVLAMIGSSNSETTLSICPYPEKGFSCTLTCLSPNTLNVLFFKTNGSKSGEGGCMISTGCKSGNRRYNVSKDSNGTYLRIIKLNRTEDEGNWHCEHGEKKSTFQKLIVYTRISHLHFKTVPKYVEKRFILTAEGHCVYPNITNATLQPLGFLSSTSSHYILGLPHHIPKIDYILYPEKCDKGEYKVRISFTINPLDFTGDVKFRVMIENGGNTSFISNYSTPITFQDCICPGICEPGLSFILLLTSIAISIVIYCFFGRHKKIVPRNWKYGKCTIPRILGACTIACLVLTTVLAFSPETVNYDNKNCKASECLCSDCACFLNSVILGLVGLVEVILTIAILVCFAIHQKDQQSSSRRNSASCHQNADDKLCLSNENSSSIPLSDNDKQSLSNENNSSISLIDKDNQSSGSEETTPYKSAEEGQQSSSRKNSASVYANEGDNQGSSTKDCETAPLIDKGNQSSSIQDSPPTPLIDNGNQITSTEESPPTPFIDIGNQSSSTNDSPSTLFIDKDNQSRSNEDDPSTPFIDKGNQRSSTDDSPFINKSNQSTSTEDSPSTPFIDKGKGRFKMKDNQKSIEDSASAPLIDKVQQYSPGEDSASINSSEKVQQDSLGEDSASINSNEKVQQDSLGEDSTSINSNEKDNQKSTEDSASAPLIDKVQQDSLGEDSASINSNENDNQKSTEDSASASLIDKVQQDSLGEDSASINSNEKDANDVDISSKEQSNVKG